MEGLITKLAEVGDDSVDNLLSSAVAAEIFGAELAIRYDTLHSSLKTVRKRRELKVPQHHCR